MVFSKKIDYRKKTPKRELFFGLPSIPFMIFLVFIAGLLIFNLIFPATFHSLLTGNVISTLNLNIDEYDPNHGLNGELSLALSNGDLIPRDSQIQILISSPKCSLYYECSDTSLSEWHTYDMDTGVCTEITSTPWETCPDASEFIGDCTDDHQCCSDGFGQGLYYENMNCSGGRFCYDQCTSYRNVSLESFIRAYDSIIPYKGNLTNGTYNNIDGSEPIGSGEGFAYCRQTIIVPKPPVSAEVIAPITGNSITGNVPLPAAGVDLVPLTVVSSRNPVVVTIKNLRADTSSPTTAKLEKWTESARPCPTTVTAEVISITGNYLCPQTISDSISIPSIAGTDSIDITLPTLSLTEGTVLKFTVNPDQTATEANYLNNEINITFTNIPQTDLLIDSASYNYDSNILSVDVKNLGENVPSTTPIYVKLYWPWETTSGSGITCPSTVYKSVTGAAISPPIVVNPIEPVLSGTCLLEQQELTTGLDYNQVKTLTFSQNIINKNIIIEISSSVPESDYANNNLSKSIGTAPIPADLILSELTYDYQTKQLKGKVKNVGGETAPASSVISVCYIGSTTALPLTKAIVTQTTCYNINSITLDSIPAGSTSSGLEGQGIILYEDLNRIYEGKTIRVTIDSTNVVTEGTIGEANNVNETYITPITQLPNLIIQNMSYDCPTKNLKITVKNIGNTNSGYYSVNLCNYTGAIPSGSLIFTGAATSSGTVPPAACPTLTVLNTLAGGLVPGQTEDLQISTAEYSGITIRATAVMVGQESNTADNVGFLTVPGIPDFEVLNSVYYSQSDQLVTQIRNNGKSTGTANLTVCKINYRLICQDLPLSAAVIAPLTGQAITSPCRMVEVCDNLPDYPQSITIQALSNITFTITNAKDNKYKITMDKEQKVCELSEYNNEKIWDYNAGTCSGSNDIYTQDPCSGTYDPTPLNDYCANSTHLIEYSCNNPICMAQTILCDYGCNSTLGVCNQAPTGNCAETDGGINPLVAGTCSGINGNFTDTCTNTALIEYSCANSLCVNSTYLISSSSSSNCFSCQITTNGGQCSTNPYSCDGWNNVYNLSLSSAPLNIITPRLDLGYFTLSVLLVSNGTIMALDSAPFLVNDTRYRYCADNYCKIGYGINIPDECSSDSDCREDTGGGSGGGTTCNEDWNCQTWSSCSSEGKRTRQCTRCGVTATESEICVYGCTENWECTDWSYCDETGIQTQICNDKNSCSARNSETVQTRNCCTESWDCKWDTCKNGKQIKVCSDNNNCGTNFLKPAEESRECAGGLDLSSIPLGVKIAVPIAIVGGILASLFLMRKKPTGIISKSGKSTSAVSKTAPTVSDYPELTSYVKTARASGVSDQDIQKKLLDAGWPKDVIDKGLKK